MSYDRPLLFSAITQIVVRDPSVSLTSLAEHLHVSGRTIENCTRQHGKQFKDLRRECLIAKVEEILVTQPLMTIKELSSATGFKSVRSFTHAIARSLHVSPRQLRSELARELITTAAASGESDLG